MHEYREYANFKLHYQNKLPYKGEIKQGFVNKRYQISTKKETPTQRF